MKKIKILLLVGFIAVITLSGCGESKKVQELTEQISSLEEMDGLPEQEIIDALENEYESLSDKSKGLVTNYSLLERYVNLNIGAIQVLQEKLDNKNVVGCEELKSITGEFLSLSEDEQNFIHGLNEYQVKCSVSAISNGLISRWKLKEELSASTYKAYQEMAKQLITEEKKAIEGYLDIEYVDSVYGDLLNEYNASLDQQFKGIEGYPDNAELYNNSYIAGYLARGNILQKLVEEYGLTVTPEYSSNLKNAYSWDEKYKGILKTGDIIPVECDLGKAKISVEGVADGSAWPYQDLASDQKLIFLKLIVENVDYYDEWNPNAINLDMFITVHGEDGISFVPLSSGWDYNGYEVALSDFFTINQGEKKKVVVPYIVEKNVHSLIVETSVGFFYVEF